MKHIAVPAARPSFDNISDVLKDMRVVLESGRMILGPYTKAFEDAFAKYTGVPYAVATGSCTAALEIVLRYIDIKGKEVIVPANTFIACPNSVIYAGGTPVFAETSGDSFCLDYDDVVKKITPKTRAVMVVHLAGMPMPEVFKLKRLCKRKGIFLLEDPSHAHGAMINGKKVGAIGDAGCFSFYPTKIMTTGVGGMITTRNKALADFAKSSRHHGQGASLETIETWGSDWVIDELSAVVGIYQLASLEKNVKKRNVIAARYRRALKKIQGITSLRVSSSVRHGYYRYLILLDEQIPKKKVLEALSASGIEAGTLYGLPCYMHTIYRKRGYKRGLCPKTEELLSRQIALPLFATMTRTHVDLVITCLKKVIKTLTPS